MGILHENLYIYIISRCIILRIRNVSDTSCRENLNTHFIFNIPPPPPPNIVLFMRYAENEGKVRQATDDNIKRRMLIACWKTEARIQTLTIYHTYCSSAATMVSANAPQCYVIRTNAFPVLFSH